MDPNFEFDFSSKLVALDLAKASCQLLEKFIAEGEEDFGFRRKELEKIHFQIWQETDEFCDSVLKFSKEHDFPGLYKRFLRELDEKYENALERKNFQKQLDILEPEVSKLKKQAEEMELALEKVTDSVKSQELELQKLAEFSKSDEFQKLSKKYESLLWEIGKIEEEIETCVKQKIPVVPGPGNFVFRKAKKPELAVTDFQKAAACSSSNTQSFQPKKSKTASLR